jgi:hypothetical protein
VPRARRARGVSGDRARQVTPERWYYGGGGAPVVVTDLGRHSAPCARSPSRRGGPTTRSRTPTTCGSTTSTRSRTTSVSTSCGGAPVPAARHARLRPTGAEIPIDWRAVAPMRANPRTDDYVAYPAIHRQMARCDAIYRACC